MKLLRIALIAVPVLLGLAAASNARGASDSKGLLRVIVVDELGAYVPEAHVYVYGRQTKQLINANAKDGILLLELPVGKYKIYSAVTRQQPEFVDRYVSHEAHIRVQLGEPSSVLLTLRNTQDPVIYMSESTRKKIGVNQY
jgi:hypothetical protein